MELLNPKCLERRCLKNNFREQRNASFLVTTGKKLSERNA
jgi:hypothetical protein